MALKRQCQSLSELEDSEWDDFKFLVRKLETSLNETFHPDLYNWSCFKNAAYRVKNPNPEVHWHLIPRYDREIEFEGIELLPIDKEKIAHCLNEILDFNFS